MNRIVISGNLTKEPEKVDGQQLCKLSVAVKNNFKNKDGEYESEFFNVAVWNKLHENCIKYLHKGSKVLVVGESHTRSYEKDGVKRYIHEIIAHEVEFLSTPKKEEKEEPKYQPIDDDGLPF